MNEKYLAGFIDADGHLSVRARKNARPDLELSISQRAEYRDVLDYAKRIFGGAIREKREGKYLELQLKCGPARKAMERLKKYMVIKRHHAEQMIELVRSAGILRTDEDVRAVRNQVRSIRQKPATTLPNFPPRKWLAGYVDGDGSFAVKKCRKTGYAYPKLTILAAPNYTAGIELIQKCFGGKIWQHGENFQYTLQLSQPSKARQVIGYFAQHLQIKKGQAYFLTGCARAGNFRDGETVRQAIKALNAQQHRLSDPTSKAANLVSMVDFSIEKKPCNWVGRDKMKRQSNLETI